MNNDNETKDQIAGLTQIGINFGPVNCQIQTVNYGPVGHSRSCKPHSSDENFEEVVCVESHREEIYETILKIVRLTNTQELLSNTYSIEDVESIFENLLMAENFDPKELEVRENLWQKLESLETELTEGYLKLNYFLHVLGNLMENGVYQNKATQMVRILFPEYEGQVKETARNYIQKGKGKSNVLEPSLIKMIEKYC